MRHFRIPKSGFRWVGSFLVPRGKVLEELKEGLWPIPIWVYVDTLPDMESARSYVRNCNGILHPHWT